MKSSQSKYSSRKKTPVKNQWRDLTISEANMTAALEQFLHQTTHLAKDEDVERIIVGDLANGFYPLAVAVHKKEKGS